jgi:hypothetical protein
MHEYKKKNPGDDFFARMQDRWQTWSSLQRALPALIITLLIFCGGAAQSFWPTTDPARYQCYALTFWLGSQATHLLPANHCSFLDIITAQPAWHMLPKEYPPLTLLLFSLPLLLPLAYYQVGFVFIMSALMLFTYWLILRFGGRGGAAAFLVFMVVGACALVPMRYDLLPAVLTLLSLIAAHKRRWTLAYIALAGGVLLKIYPILLLPALFIAEQRSKDLMYVPTTTALRQLPAQLWHTLKDCLHWQWWNSLLFFGCIIVVTGLFALANFQNAVVSQISYFLTRPIQIESSGASLLWLAHLAGMPWTVIYNFGSINLCAQHGSSNNLCAPLQLSQIVSPLFTGLFVLGVLFILWLQWQRKMDLAQTTIALTLVFITTGKVFSPQYLIWLIPLLAYSGLFTKFWTLMLGSISFLTTFIYIVFYSQILDPIHIKIPAGFFEVAIIRNILLSILTLAYLFNWFQSRNVRDVDPKASLMKYISS